MTTDHDDNNSLPYSNLSGAEKKKLRGIAQLLQPRLHVGKQGVTSETLKELEIAFKKEDLIKVRFSADRGAILRLIEEIVKGTESFCVCNVGKTATFFRQKREDDSGE
jgi:RNA-binding protein